jgi:hypothetical protein
MMPQSADPFVYPNIHVNYFNVSFDLDVLVAGLKLTRKIFKTEPLRCVCYPYSHLHIIQSRVPTPLP